MNHYPRHIGDWRTATWNLTKVQRCIYSDLIDTYYDKEQAISADNISEEMGCRTPEEIAALTYVLGRYFRLEGGVYRHERCDEELAHFHKLVTDAKKAGKASASARAQRKGNGASTVVQREANDTSTPIQPPNTQYPPSLTDVKGGGAATPSPPPPQEPEEPVYKLSKKCPKTFTVTPRMWGWSALECPLLSPGDVERETKKFRDHTFGRSISDWTGAWRNWLRKEQVFREQRAGVTRGPAMNAKEAERQRVLESMYGNKEKKDGASGQSAIDVESRVVGNPETDPLPPDEGS